MANCSVTFTNRHPLSIIGLINHKQISTCFLSDQRKHKSRSLQTTARTREPSTMGCTLSKCCRGGKKRPAKTLSWDRYESVHKDSGEEPSKTLISSSMDHVTESFESVYKVALKRFELNHDTLGNIQELKHELSDNPQLVSFIEDYLGTSIETLELFSSLEECLDEAHSTVYLAGRAVYLFECGMPISSVFEDLEQLKTQGNPFHLFPQNYVDKLKSLCEVHGSYIQKLSEREKDLDRKLGKVEYWKTVGSCVCFVAVVGLLIGSAVLAIMGAPPVAITILGLAGSAIALLEKEIELLTDKRKSAIEGERDIIIELKKQIYELDDINELVKQLEELVNSVDGYAGFRMEKRNNDEEVKKEVKLTKAMYGIKIKAKRLNKRIEDMKKEVNLRRENLRTAVATILMAVKTDKYECVSCVGSMP